MPTPSAYGMVYTFQRYTMPPHPSVRVDKIRNDMQVKGPSCPGNGLSYPQGAATNAMPLPTSVV